VIESQTKAMGKIIWRRQVSDPLGKGNGSTHPTQNYAQAKSANHQTKARKTTKSSPCTHASSPWTNACKTPLEIRAAATTQHWPVRPVNTTGQTGVQQVNRTCTLTGQTGDLDRSERWTPEPRNGSKPPEKPSKCIQQAISSSNFSPLLAMHESSQKCKTLNLELLK
jgi:hypothetical protein